MMVRHQRSSHFAACFFLYLGVVGTRCWLEIRAGSIKGGLSGSFIASRFDPRNSAAIEAAVNARESDAFRNRLATDRGDPIPWPGLKSLQVSFDWLQVLQGVHVESSYSGDFSWIFSKLDRIYRSTPAAETAWLVALAPFYFLMNKDGAGATSLMNAMIHRAPKAWRVWFWSGFHALENLRNASLAGDLYRQAALIPGSPVYLGALSVRLSQQEIFSRLPSPKNFIREELPEELVRKIRATRPEWFAEDGKK